MDTETIINFMDNMTVLEEKQFVIDNPDEVLSMIWYLVGYSHIKEEVK